MVYGEWYWVKYWIQRGCLGRKNSRSLWVRVKQKPKIQQQSPTVYLFFYSAMSSFNISLYCLCSGDIGSYFSLRVRLCKEKEPLRMVLVMMMVTTTNCNSTPTPYPSFLIHHFLLIIFGSCFFLLSFGGLAFRVISHDEALSLCSSNTHIIFSLTGIFHFRLKNNVVSHDIKTLVMF